MDNSLAMITLHDMVHQFAPTMQRDGKLYVWTGGLGVLKDAFDVLGWPDPREIPERMCDVDGCISVANCGTPTPDGYKNVCGHHFSELTKNG